MSCKTCPHHVRHGKPSNDGKNIEFNDSCGLRMRQTDEPPKVILDPECTQYPFSKSFDYMQCHIYLDIFKSGVRRNDVIPTKDFQYSAALQGGSITDLELL
jgi:hypothetical protein